MAMRTFINLSRVAEDQDMILAYPYFSSAYIDERSFREDLRRNCCIIELNSFIYKKIIFSEKLLKFNYHDIYIINVDDNINTQ